jgi:hypothetical protein
LKLFLIAADGKDKQPGKGKATKGGVQPLQLKDTEKEAKDPIEGMSENFLIIDEPSLLI